MTGTGGKVGGTASTARKGTGRDRQIVVVGGGFAGLWAALGAVSCLDGRGVGEDDVRVLLVSKDPYLTIRPRLYERSLDGLRVPLPGMLARAGVELVQAEVTAIDVTERAVIARQAGHDLELRYDRLVLAAGSHVKRPPVEGLAEHAFTVDTYADALRLAEHLASLPTREPCDARRVAVVIGSGFTGLEVATELVDRLHDLLRADAAEPTPRVTLVESASMLGPDLGPNPRPSIERALEQLGIVLRLGDPAVAVTPSEVILASGRRVAAATTVWTAGLQASPLAAGLGVATDQLGRVSVDEALRVEGQASIFAAGDVARAQADAGHIAPMSCQHAIPMGKFAGYNAAADLIGDQLAAYQQPDYVTCIDLGSAGAIFTRGWERPVLFTGSVAKRLKEQINRYDIYPPVAADRAALLRAAQPEPPTLEGLVQLGHELARVNEPAIGGSESARRLAPC